MLALDRAMMQSTTAPFYMGALSIANPHPMSLSLLANRLIGRSQE
jgi:hypothetical protein